MKLPLSFQNNATTAFVLAILTIVTLLYQVYQPQYQAHLQVDVAVFHQRAAFFHNQNSWTNLTYNEYQPGALWFFVGISKLAADPNNYGAFLSAFVLTNIFLIILLFFFAHRHGHRFSLPILALIIITSGPILLYRFELIVAGLTLISWYWFTKRKHALSALALGLATAIKVYPVILVPLLLISVLRRRTFAFSVNTLAAFTLGLVLPILAAIASGNSLLDIERALSFHSDKPISAEGIIGQTVMLSQKILDLPLRITPGNGVYGFTSDLPYFTNQILNYVWVPVLLMWYGYLWWRHRQLNLSQFLFPYFTILLFLIFSKVLNPQYLIWVFIFFPFINPKTLSASTASFLITAIAAANILTTIVYPLNFSTYLDWLNGINPDPTLFHYAVARNILLLVITAISLRSILRKPATT